MISIASLRDTNLTRACEPWLPPSDSLANVRRRGMGSFGPDAERGHTQVENLCYFRGTGCQPVLREAPCYGQAA